MDAIINTADMAWEMRCRDEDMRQRSIDNFRREIDDTRRSVDETAARLKAIAHPSALIAGFAMIVMVEIQLPKELNVFQITIFGLTSASVIVLMLISMLNTTMMLVGVMHYDCVQRNPPFKQFWNARCQDDYMVAYKAFTAGVPLFMILLAQMGWIIFQQYDAQSRNIAASVVTAAATVPAGWWFKHVNPKWKRWNSGVTHLTRAGVENNRGRASMDTDLNSCTGGRLHQEDSRVARVLES